MQGFGRFGQFRHALRASREATCDSPFTPYVDDLRFAEGLLFSVALVLPFWLSLALAIELLTH